MVQSPLAAGRFRPLALTIVLGFGAACSGHPSDKGSPDGGATGGSPGTIDVGVGGDGMAGGRASGGASGGTSGRGETGGAAPARGGAAGGAAGAMGGAGGLRTPNLIRNGDAEAAPGSPDGKPVPTPDWTSTGQATAILYGSGLEYPAINDPVPADHGLNLFSGGPDDPTSALSQTVDLSAYATAIDAGQVQATLSGYFGGYSVQDDNAALSATFLGADGQSLGPAVMIGGLLAADRSDHTGLWPRSQQVAVPALTRSVEVVLKMTRVVGTIDDGYADDLSLILTGP